jgi:hypothetical protein
VQAIGTILTSLGSRSSSGGSSGGGGGGSSGRTSGSSSGLDLFGVDDSVFGVECGGAGVTAVKCLVSVEGCGGGGRRFNTLMICSRV